MTRDQRRDVLLMRRLGYRFESIAKFLGTTISSYHYTCCRGTPETQHQNGGRRVHFPPEVVTRRVEYVKDYQTRQKAAGEDEKTGKMKMPMLSWNMIRENTLADVNGQIPKELKFTDDAMKKVLNAHNLFLRNPTLAENKELARLRGKQQWLEKLAKDRAEAVKKAAEATAAGQPVSAELTALASEGTAAEPPELDGEGFDDADDDVEVVDDVYSESDDAPSDIEDDGDDDGGEQPMQIEDQLRQAIATPENYR